MFPPGRKYSGNCPTSKVHFRLHLTSKPQASHCLTIVLDRNPLQFVSIVLKAPGHFLRSMPPRLHAGLTGHGMRLAF